MGIIPFVMTNYRLNLIERSSVEFAQLLCERHGERDLCTLHCNYVVKIVQSGRLCFERLNSFEKIT